MNPLEVRHHNLRAESQQRLLEFLNVEVQLGFTFAEFAAAERDLGNLEHSRHAKRDAEKAAQTIRRFAAWIADPHEQTTALRHCEELERAIAVI